MSTLQKEKRSSLYLITTRAGGCAAGAAIDMGLAAVHQALRGGVPCAAILGRALRSRAVVTQVPVEGVEDPPHRHADTGRRAQRSLLDSQPCCAGAGVYVCLGNVPLHLLHCTHEQIVRARPTHCVLTQSDAILITFNFEPKNMPPAGLTVPISHIATARAFDAFFQSCNSCSARGRHLHLHAEDFAITHGKLAAAQLRLLGS